MLYNWGQPDRLDTILDTCIDQLEFEAPEDLLRRYPQAAPKLAPLLNVAAALGEMRDVHLSADANERNRARLRQAVAAKRRRRVTVFTPSFTRVVGYAAMLVALFGGSLSWMTVASASALPNDRLYSWKRNSENIWLRVQRSPESAATVSLGLAERRADEVAALYQRTGEVDANVVAQLGLEYTRALSFIAATPPDQSQQLLQHLHTLGAEHTTQFTALAQQTSGDEREQLLDAVAASTWVQSAQPNPAVSPPPPSVTDDLKNVQPSVPPVAKPSQAAVPTPAASESTTEGGKTQAPGQDKKQPAQDNANNTQPSNPGKAIAPGQENKPPKDNAGNTQPGNASKPEAPAPAKPKPTPPGATNKTQPPGQNKEPKTPAKPATAAPSQPPAQENKPPKDNNGQAKPEQPAVEAPNVVPVPVEPVIPEPVIPEPVIPEPVTPEPVTPGNDQPDKDKDKDKDKGGNGNKAPEQGNDQSNGNGQGQVAEPKIEPTPEIVVEQPAEDKPKDNGNGGGQGKKP